MSRRSNKGVLVLVAAVVTGLALTATFTLGRTYRSLSNPTLGMARRPAFVPAPDPILRAEAGLDPNSTDVAPGDPGPTIRTIQVFPLQILLVQGGQVARTIQLPQAVTTPAQIVDAIADESWMRRSTPQEIVVDAALLMEAGTTFAAAPPLERLVLETAPGVFLGSNEATLSFDHVAVEASDRAVPRGGEVGPGTRPFVLAEGGRMLITSSSFRYLGRDWNGSYGVSWIKGASGGATDSTFEHNFMGAFASTAIDLRFDHDTFRDSSLYGLNPHAVTAGLTLVNNVIERNGRDGLILSGRVTGAEVHGNQSRHNGINGITVDAASDENVVQGNLVRDNHGDGIVISSAARNRVVDNQIVNNRVAIRFSGSDAGTNVARGNILDGNGLATQGRVSSRNTVRNNGDRWRPPIVLATWLLAAALLWALSLATRRSQRSRDRKIELWLQNRAAEGPDGGALRQPARDVRPRPAVPQPAARPGLPAAGPSPSPSPRRARRRPFVQAAHWLSSVLAAWVVHQTSRSGSEASR